MINPSLPLILLELDELELELDELLLIDEDDEEEDDDDDELELDESELLLTDSDDEEEDEDDDELLLTDSEDENELELDDDELELDDDELELDDDEVDEDEDAGVSHLSGIAIAYAIEPSPHSAIPNSASSSSANCDVDTSPSHSLFVWQTSLSRYKMFKASRNAAL